MDDMDMDIGQINRIKVSNFGSGDLFATAFEELNTPLHVLADSKTCSFVRERRYNASRVVDNLNQLKRLNKEMAHRNVSLSNASQNMNLLAKGYNSYQRNQSKKVKVQFGGRLKGIGYSRSDSPEQKLKKVAGKETEQKRSSSKRMATQGKVHSGRTEKLSARKGGSKGSIQNSGLRILAKHVGSNFSSKRNTLHSTDRLPTKVNGSYHMDAVVKLNKKKTGRTGESERMLTDIVNPKSLWKDAKRGMRPFLQKTLYTTTEEVRTKTQDRTERQSSVQLKARKKKEWASLCKQVKCKEVSTER